MAFWVYILRCADSSYYTGHTDNLEKRIHEHHLGAITSCYTFKRRPLQLAFSQDFPTRIEALTSERQIKGWSRKKKEAMMRGDWVEVSRLAKSSNTCRTNNTVRTEILDVVRTEPFDTVRPELVEGMNGVERRQATPAIFTETTSTVRPEPRASRIVEGISPSDHPSTSSGRTDGESSL
ncbi:GIY-YIG nuclease family protein [Methylobacter tundripaludum]|uniref:Excinuclease ABC C subunit domain protein n=1 Tax=Methylobacter tundripaludum (strain ATCC BAA-1195 / DSM 17260 / SV96) TaxID=697282 RepID=G3IWP8_METTV|nr:GIY-YIG nuclease family protein [Methylobacter tundripaludum]EGW23107.1 Excinuclease ABC C subunit domain protein [Methylobacter tundripaludum SV96]